MRRPDEQHIHRVRRLTQLHQRHHVIRLDFQHLIHQSIAQRQHQKEGENLDGFLNQLFHSFRAPFVRIGSR